MALLGAGVVVAPVFMRLGLGSVLDYPAAGVIIGPFRDQLFTIRRPSGMSPNAAIWKQPPANEV